MMRVVAIVAIWVCAFTVAGQTPVRLSWQEFSKDPKRVQSFRNAVAAMKALDTADPTSAEYRGSWIYWGNMHGYFGPQAKNGTVAQWRKANNLDGARYDAAFAGVTDMTPPDAIAAAVWDQCQHGTDYFFPWHRLYLKYFEQVLQHAANDPSLRLPYWDYTDVAQLGMPAEFTTPTYRNAAGEEIANPLYEARRANGWNAPGRKALNTTDTNIDQSLDIPSLLNTTNQNGDPVNGYQRTIELSPHGYTHCAVMGCRATVMGAVPYSSNDPIFYLHHANIDRTWDCWRSIGGHQNPTGAWLQQPFSFVDADGNQVTNLVGDLDKPGFIDYAYQQASNCARGEQPLALAAALRVAPSEKRARTANAALATPVMIGEQTDDLVIDGPVARKTVTMPATASLAHPRQFALRDQDELDVATDLILRGVHFAAHPNAEFRVFIERADNPAVREFVGTLSFFSDEPAGEHAHHTPATNQRRFDITNALRALRLEGTGTLALNVAVEVEDDDVEDFDAARTGLVIDEIEIQVRRDR